MFILIETMLICWLTHITSSPCSKLVSYCMQLSSTQHLSSSPSSMVSEPTQLLSLTSHAYKSALNQPLLSQLWQHLTLGHFHKMVTSFTTRDCSCPQQSGIQLDILCSHHDHHLAGHLGITKMIKNIHHQFYWPQMVTFITDYIHSCSVCSRSKSLHHKPFGPH